MLQEGTELVPGYKLQQFLGKGGYGEVWSATAPGGMRAALKCIPLEGKEGLKKYNSIQRLKSLHHPHLLPIHALWLLNEQQDPIDTAPFEGEQGSWRVGEMHGEVPHPSMLVVAMPLGEKNLFELLEEHLRQGDEGIPTEPLLDYLSDVAKGLDFLNQSTPTDSEFGRQHCDVKPHNILLMGNAAMICDFGLARVLSDQLLTPGTTVSTAYAAPEFLRENRPSSATDQYSLAITYYELRTGKLPFDRSLPEAVTDIHSRGDLSFADVSALEEHVLRTATSLDPSQRYASVGELVRELGIAVRQQAQHDPRVTMIDVNVPSMDAGPRVDLTGEPKPAGRQQTGSETVRLATTDPRVTMPQSPLGIPAMGSQPGWFPQHRNKLSIVGIVLLAGLALFSMLNHGDDAYDDDIETEVAVVDPTEQDDAPPVRLNDPNSNSENPWGNDNSPKVSELDNQDQLLVPNDEIDLPTIEESSSETFVAPTQGDHSQTIHPNGTTESNDISSDQNDDLQLIPADDVSTDRTPDPAEDPHTTSETPDSSVNGDEPSGPPETSLNTPTTPADDVPRPETETPGETTTPPTATDPTEIKTPSVDPAVAAAVNDQALQYLQRGDEYNRQKKTRRAVAMYTKALNLKPTDPQLLYRLHTRRAIACRKEGKSEDGPKFQSKALSDFEKAVSYASDNKRKSGLYFSRGTLLLEMQRPDEAVDDLTRAIEMSPSNAYLYQARAEAFRRRNQAGDEERAVQDKTEAQSLSAGS